MPMTNSGSPSQIYLSDTPALERAMTWLEWMLSRGPVLVTVIKTLAPLHGQQDWAVVEEAKAALGVEAVTFRDRLWWQMSKRIAVPQDAPPSKP